MKPRLEVLCFDTNGVFLKQVSVGSLPDMIVFTPDAKSFDCE
jgi:hypothetical protein